MICMGVSCMFGMGDSCVYGVGAGDIWCGVCLCCPRHVCCWGLYGVEVSIKKFCSG